MDDEAKCCIESAECIINKLSNQLREIIFMDDNYNLTEVLNIAENIKAMSEIIIAQSKKLLNNK